MSKKTPNIDYIAEPLRGLAVPLDSVNLDPANLNQHDERSIEAIANSMKRFGFRVPIVVQRDGMIVRAGNGRVLAARRLGWTHIAAVVCDEASVDAVAYSISENRTHDFSSFDDEALAAVLKELPDDLRIDAGFSDAEMDALLKEIEGPAEVVEDEVPEVEAEIVSRPGDLWLLGEHRLLCGDSTKADDVERVMGGERAVLSFTSPPYANQRTYTKEGDLSTEYLSRFIPAAAPFVDVFAVNLGLARHGGRLVRYWDDYILSAEAAGLGLLSWNVWSREGMDMSVGQVTAMFPIQHEWILVFGEKVLDLRPTVPNKSAGASAQCTNRRADGSMTVKKHTTIRPMRELGTIITLASVAKSEDHPAQFPIELAARYIEAFDGSVYEPFSGSGTTIIAAEQLGRRCCGIEISGQYCDVAVRRWQKLTGKDAVLESTGETFAERAGVEVSA